MEETHGAGAEEILVTSELTILTQIDLACEKGPPKRSVFRCQTVAACYEFPAIQLPNCPIALHPGDISPS
jgi:hypothetical protein